MQTKPVFLASFFVCLLFFISFFLIHNVLAIDSPTNYCAGSYISSKTSVSASQESACGHASTDSANSDYICPSNLSKQPANLTKLEDNLKNPFYTSFIPTATCTENGGWCSCYLGCSTYECCSGNCEYYTCMDYGCYPDYPNLCNGNCYSCTNAGDVFTCDPVDGPVCCPPEYPYYCYIDNSCWSGTYLPNPCGSGCPPGLHECDGSCYSCTDPNDIFICDSGIPYCLPPHTDIRLESFVSTPTQVDAGDYVSFTARLKNYGGITGTTNVEAAIIPTTFWSSSLNYTPESYVDTAECCPGNTYFQAKEVTLNPLKEDIVIFTVKAPTPTSIDACDDEEPIRSAWGSYFMYEAGTYDVCGGGYTSQIETTGPVICDYAPACTYTDDDDCLDSNTVENYYKETLCEGGCSNWKYTTYDCASGFFCKDPGDAYCNSCSTSCDSVCQSSACYGTDPDCASDGSLQSCGTSSGPCDGEITTIVKDNNGNPILGIKVYIDGAYKGITDSYGKFTATTSDSYCGISHIPGCPGSPLQNIDHTMGFWIDMENSDTLTITGKLPHQTDITLYGTYEGPLSGWNLVGYTPTTNTAPGTIISGLENDLEVIYGNFEQPNYWESYILEINAGTMSVMKQGYGYWIRTDTTTDLVMTYTNN